MFLISKQPGNMLHVESQSLLPGVVRLELDRLQAEATDVLEPEGGWVILLYDLNTDWPCFLLVLLCGVQEEIWKFE